MVIVEEKDHGELHPFIDKKTMGVENVRLSPSLTDTQAEELRGMIHKFEEVFSDLPGRTEVVRCELQCSTEEPVHVKQYPLPLAMQEVIESEIEEMLKQGIIERANSPYNAPLVVVK